MDTMPTTTTTTSNPRRYTRVTCNAAAIVTAGAASLAGVCENLSVGGAFFKGATAPTVTEVKMVLCLPSMGPIEIVGEVRHARDDGFGIRFTHLPSNSLMAICSYVGTLH